MIEKRRLPKNSVKKKSSSLVALTRPMTQKRNLETTSRALAEVVEDTSIEERALKGKKQKDTCDTSWYGLGLSGGITEFNIVHPGGGLHRNFFKVSLYRNPGGQIDWNVFGPIKTDKHYYEYCDAIIAPSITDREICPAGTFSTAGNGNGPCV